MRRREFLLAAAASKSFAAPAGRAPLLLLSADDAREIKNGISAAQRARLRGLADRDLRSGPWSVTFHRPQGTALPANEYFSEGPYWWPDPKNPSGPYIRRDGERNPRRFDHNHHDLGAMAAAVLTLGMASYFLDDAPSAAHAARILGTWFAAPETRMAPNLDHAQAIRGRTSGHGTGIIDTVSLIYAVQGIVLLERAGRLNADLPEGLRRWFADYLHWMLTSKNGLDEERAANNHGTWWSAQVAAYASYLGDESTLRMVWNRYRTVLVPGEIQPDGSCPRELARTNSLSYSAYNLDAFSVLCRLAQENDVDLWHFQTANGISLAKAVAYVTPYLQHPETWRAKQIGPFNAGRVVFPGLAGAGLHSQKVLDVYRQLPRENSAWVLLVDWIVRAEQS
ncbi:MAG: alginate lyase family protein [Bryobacteraceae bacterium]